MIKQFTWDWKEQPPMTEIGAAVTAMSAKGQVFAYHPDTDSDCYAVVLADRELTTEQVKRIYDYPDAVVLVEYSVEMSRAGASVVESLSIPLADLIGLDATRRDEVVGEWVQEAALNVVNWGHIELGEIDEPVEGGDG